MASSARRISATRTCAQKQLAATAAQGGAGLEERAQHGQHLLDGAVLERNDFKGLLRP
jgi:hypothetical protein